MKDIKKAIEEEIGRYLYKTDGWTTKRCSMEYITNFILSKWQDSERWRKVEEELPEEVMCRCSLPMLTKDKYGVYRVAIYSYIYNFFIIGNTSVYGITHWKPIH